MWGLKLGGGVTEMRVLLGSSVCTLVLLGSSTRLGKAGSHLPLFHKDCSLVDLCSALLPVLPLFTACLQLSVKLC